MSTECWESYIKCTICYTICVSIYTCCKRPRLTLQKVDESLEVDNLRFQLVNDLLLHLGWVHNLTDGSIDSLSQLIRAAQQTKCFTPPPTATRLPYSHLASTTKVSLSLSLSLSLSILMAIFPGGPGLAGTRMSPLWILLELRVTEVVVTTGAIRRAKLQSKLLPPTKQHPVFFTGRMPFLSPNQQCQSTEGNSTKI